ncbi:MAG: ComF family protein [Desulfobacteraceae bacterium]|jgi:ComF family protein
MPAWQTWIDLLFPPRCAACDRFLAPEEGHGVCAVCRSEFLEVKSPLCIQCGVPLITGPPEDRLCEACLRKPPAYEVCRAVFVYQGPLLQVIHRFKYAGKARLADILGPWLGGLARKCLPEGMNALVMPVPLSPRRLRERGFNQSLLLARHVAKEKGLPVDFLSLRRVRDTPPQAALGRDARRTNVRAAFAVTDPGGVKERDIVLVDDVSTTGSTLDACSRALLRAGARRVFCLVLARAPVHSNETEVKHGTLQSQDSAS